MSVTRNLTLAQELTVLANMIQPATGSDLTRRFSYCVRDIGDRFAPHLKDASAQQALLAALTAFRKRDVLPANNSRFELNARTAVASLLDAADAQGGLGKFGHDLYTQKMALAVEDGVDVFSVWYFPKPRDAARRKIYEDGLKTYAVKNPEACAARANESLVSPDAFKNYGDPLNDNEIAQFRKLAELALDTSLENAHTKDVAQSLRLASALKKTAIAKIREHAHVDAIQREHQEKLKLWIQSKISGLSKTDPQAALKIALEIEALDMSRPEYKSLPVVTSEGALNPAINLSYAHKLSQQISWHLDYKAFYRGAAHCDKLHAAKISRALAAFYQGLPDLNNEAHSLFTAYMLTGDDADATRMLDRYQEIYVTPDYKQIAGNSSGNPQKILHVYMPLVIAKETSNPEIEKRALETHEAVLKKAASVSADKIEEYLRKSLMENSFFDQPPLKGNGEKQKRLAQSFSRSWISTLNEIARSDDHAYWALCCAEQALQDCPGYTNVAKAAIDKYKPLAAAQRKRHDEQVQIRKSQTQRDFDQAASNVPPMTVAQFLELVGKDPEPEPALKAA